MEIRMGGGRLATIRLDPSTKMNVEGTMYRTHCSVSFWNEHDNDEITIFADRAQLLAFGKKLVENISESEVLGVDVVS